MDSNSKLTILGVSVSGALIAVGGLMFWKWLKHRNGHHHGGHNHGGHHHGHQKLFDDINVWLAAHYASPSEHEFVPKAYKDALDFPVWLANVCKKQLSVSCHIFALRITNSILMQFNFWVRLYYVG